MTCAERRKEILRLISARKYEKISNLATEFDVSERTIRRDIKVLSLTEPLYTVMGRHAGGVYIVDSYRSNKTYFDDKTLYVLSKVLSYIENNAYCCFNEIEINIIIDLIRNYTKPIRSKK